MMKDRIRTTGMTTCLRSAEILLAPESPAINLNATGGNSNFWACGEGCAGGGLQTDGTCGCACQCRSGMPAELRNSAGPCKLGGKEITIQNGEGLCVTASGHKNGAKILAKKCKDGSSTQQWQIGPM